MALQGDLASFALPDVLRLLAGTGKTGRLGVTAPDGAGEVWLRDGELVGGSVTSSPHASQPADLVFELLRVDGGSFAFDEGDQLVDGGERSSVTEAIDAAQALVAEWVEVETVVPSVHAGVGLTPELGGHDVTVSAEQWRLLASLRRGTTVRSIADERQVTDLVASRWVKGLVEAGLVDLDDAPTVAEPADTFGLGGFVETQDGSDEGSEVGDEPGQAVGGDLAILSAEGGPVVLESSDDALLPEPLPGSGTTFAGDLEAMGTVDGRSFEAVEADASAGSTAPGERSFTSAWQAHGDFGDGIGSDDEGPAPSLAPTAEADPVDESHEAPARHQDEEADDQDAAGDDRGSLLKFLSSVKS